MKIIQHLLPLYSVTVFSIQKFEIDMEQPPDPDFVEDMADVEARTLEQQKEYGKI